MDSCIIDVSGDNNDDGDDGGIGNEDDDDDEDVNGNDNDDDVFWMKCTHKLREHTLSQAG